MTGDWLHIDIYIAMSGLSCLFTFFGMYFYYDIDNISHIDKEKHMIFIDLDRFNKIIYFIFLSWICSVQPVLYIIYNFIYKNEYNHINPQDNNINYNTFI